MESNPFANLRKQLKKANKDIAKRASYGPVPKDGHDWVLGRDPYPPIPCGWGAGIWFALDLCMDRRHADGRSDITLYDRQVLSNRVWHRRFLQLKGYCICDAYWEFLDLTTGELREHDPHCPLQGKRVE